MRTKLSDMACDRGRIEPLILINPGMKTSLDQFVVEESEQKLDH